MHVPIAQREGHGKNDAGKGRVTNVTVFWRY